MCEFKIRKKTTEAGVPERPGLLTVATVANLTPVNIYHSLYLVSGHIREMSFRKLQTQKLIIFQLNKSRLNILGLVGSRTH